MNCKECPRFKTCVELCPKAEAYINQDYNEDQWLKIRFKEHIERYEVRKMENVSTTEAILQNYFIDRMKPKDIAERYYKSQQYVYYIIKKYTVIIAENIKKSVKTG